MEFDFCGFFISCQRGRQGRRTKSEREAEMKGAPAPLGGDRLAVLANTEEHERAGRWQDRQEGPVLGSLLSWGGAGGEGSSMGYSQLFPGKAAKAAW